MQEPKATNFGLRWSVAQRLEFIEFRLIWEGRINRPDIADKFGVTVQQASANLGLYEQLAPENIAYLRSQKTFVQGSNFSPRFVKEKADRQLLQLAAICAGLLDQPDTWFSELPSMASVPFPIHHVDTQVAQRVLLAIRERRSVEIVYQSMERPDPIRRMIEPHALGHDGQRWHVRAWCLNHGDFRDFVLSRVEAIEIKGPSASDPAKDAEWNEHVELVIAPNPGLKEAVRKAISREYGMERGRLRPRMRAALAFYAIKHLNLDLKGLAPERQRLVLTNMDEVASAVEKAKNLNDPSNVE